ncbi:uncharacterized protein MYCFIDRAFT_210733 [Pseudocercospora fijiensis CIRAD86]|uniref:Cell wall protein PhiA n=1 Tax=Pseudocercospora fijiensis (strain CIRAD86) TaxID=383855 RepID=M2ZY96_PSEFD|nr:uncharacterized protein MYCFIDRAFT_210733 [Pseudocercospora fijiensis CIRAD86]EME83924.1 hypothetical protein MYCFIDRAFT_210733 [Pseudocercospora fijiensis CIRAD86]
MKAFTLALFATAVAAQAGTAQDPFLFTATTQGSSQALQEAVINANGKAFWVGKPTTNECQKDADPKSAICDSNTKNNHTTIFSYVNGEDKFSLSVNIKGGQAVYVDPSDGHLAFTAGGDFGKYPDGAVVNGFAKVRTKLVFEDMDWIACPTDGGNVYQIFALSRSKATGCSGITFVLTDAKPPYRGGPSTAYVYV